jgi:hypothetical protein
VECCLRYGNKNKANWSDFCLRMCDIHSCVVTCFGFRFLWFRSICFFVRMCFLDFWVCSDRPAGPNLSFLVLFDRSCILDGSQIKPSNLPGMLPAAVSAFRALVCSGRFEGVVVCVCG